MTMSNPFRVKNIENSSGHPTRWYSSRQENAVAKAIGGKPTPNSGATTFQPGDVSIDNLFSLECKTKTSNSDSISIKRAWFDKQIAENIQSGKKYSAIVINFGPDAPYNENHYIIDEYLFQELLDYLRSKNDEN